MKVYLATLGCKLNESELEHWSRRFAQDGHQIVSDPGEADLFVLNTCTVTHTAARKSRQLARQLARANPTGRLILTGCYSTIAPDEAASLPNVALVIPNADKDRLVQLAGRLIDDTRYQTTETGCRLPEAASGSLGSLDATKEPTDNPLWPADGGSPTIPHLRTRAFVKIMDGCNMSCTYCIIPLARGKEASRPLKDIVAEVKSLVDAGYKEIILTGVQISVYSHNGDKVHGLRDLTAALLGETAVPRLRLTSIAPWDLDESLFDLWRDPRLCRHIHLSLQSGSDTVLRRMRRPYSTEQFARVVDRARAAIPDLGITTDVIVGFPGESDVEFEQSARFVERIQFSRIHVFPYSPRAGTVAATMPLQVADRSRESRARVMQTIADACAVAFAKRFVGRQMDVLWESSEPNAPQVHSQFPLLWSGYTDNYIRVTAPGNSNLQNQITPATITALGNSQGAEGVAGELAF